MDGHALCFVTGTTTPDRVVVLAMSAACYFPNMSWDAITVELASMPETTALEIEEQAGKMDGRSDPILIFVPLHVIVADNQPSMTMTQGRRAGSRGAPGGGPLGGTKFGKTQQVVRPYPRTIIGMDTAGKAIVICFKVCFWALWCVVVLQIPFRTPLRTKTQSAATKMGLSRTIP